MAGAICTDCGKGMLSAKGCNHTHFLYPDGTLLPRHPVGTGRDHGVAKSRPRKDRCTDCGAIPGTYHHGGCDAEKCPRCGHQVLSCHCSIGHLPRRARIVRKNVVATPTVMEKLRAIGIDREKALDVVNITSDLEGKFIDPDWWNRI